MAIYGNLTQNTVDISVLESSFDNEIKNFNRIMESIDVLNESGIILEKVSSKVIIEKLKTVFKKFKEFVSELLKKIKELIFKKNKSTNSSNNSTTSKMNETDEYKKYKIPDAFFKFDDYLSKYEDYLALPIYGGKIIIHIDNDDEVKEILKNLSSCNMNLEAFEKFHNFAKDTLDKVERYDDKDSKDNFIKYYKDLESKLSKSSKDVYNTLEKMSKQTILALTTFMYEMESYESDSLSLLAKAAMLDITKLREILNLGKKYIIICNEIIQVGSVYTIPY